MSEGGFLSKLRQRIVRSSSNTNLNEAGTKGKKKQDPKTISKTIDKQIANDQKKSHEKFQVLLLGGSECGKTTIFKQMKILHLNGFTDKDRATFRDPIRRNAIDSLVQLLNACKEMRIIHESSLQTPLHEFDLFATKTISDQEDIDFGEKILKCMLILWKSSGVQLAYTHRWSFYLLDSAKYFLDSLARIGAKDYLPDVQDIVQCRFPTKGTEEITFRYENMNFCMVDVGGQRSERRKWIHCFDNVSMLLFVAALSDYDLLDPENNNQKRLSANRYIFKTIVQSSFFKEAAIVLFLNKLDVFTEKLKYQPLNKYYPDYPGENDPKEASEYIGNQFRKCVRDKNRFFVFYTTATDTRNVEFVFASAVTHIINQNLRATGSY